MVKKQLTTEAQGWLIREVSDEEIKKALFQMNIDKSPGPDGFNTGFFHKNGDVVANDICSAVTNCVQQSKRFILNPKNY